MEDNMGDIFVGIEDYLYLCSTVFTPKIYRVCRLK